MAKAQYGWRPNYPEIERMVGESQHPVLSAARAAYKYEKKTTLLYEPIMWWKPNWKRGAQAIGDCVSWASALGCLAVLCKIAMKHGSRKIVAADTCTESQYGGSRVEARGKKENRGGDGSYVMAAAKWVKNWGVTLRIDYSKQTGNAEHDLRKYSGTRAKSWGRYGNGGRQDNGALDSLAKQMPVAEYSTCNNFEDVAYAIAGTKTPVVVGSGQGFEGMSLDRDGFWSPRGSWSHAMTFLGIRFGSRPGALLFNSWGPRTTKNTGNRWPENMPDNIVGCSGWVDADVVTKMARQGDCCTLLDVGGIKPDTWSWDDILWKPKK